MQKILIGLTIAIGIITLYVAFYYIMLPNDDEAVELVKALFLDPHLDYELKVEKEVKLHFENFSHNFDDSKIILLFSTPDARYDFIIDPEGEMPFILTLSVFIFDKPEFWIHYQGTENYIKYYKKFKQK